ncbi:Uncharacterised protein [uncultured archaeon]|nr:Uncharacterised protein [uncultured archaeon]
MAKVSSIKHRQGQSSIEYLVTYSWVILILGLAVVALMEMGVFNPPIPPRGSLGFSQLKPSDWVVSTDNHIYLDLTNQAGDNIEIKDTDFKFNIGEINCTKVPDNEKTRYPLKLGPGASTHVTIECDNTPQSIPNAYRPGDYYEAPSKITYYNLRTQTTHESVGKIFGPIEVPAQQILSSTTTTQTVTTTTETKTTTTTSSTTTTTNNQKDNPPQVRIYAYNASTGIPYVTPGDTVTVDVNGTDDCGLEWVVGSYHDNGTGSNPANIQWLPRIPCPGYDEDPNDPEMDCSYQYTLTEDTPGVYYVYAQARERTDIDRRIHPNCENRGRYTSVVNASFRVYKGWLFVNLAYPKPNGEVNV